MGRFECKDLSVREVSKIAVHPLNRSLNRSHVNEIKKALKRGELSQMMPIIVNKSTNMALDGHHRQVAFLEAVKEGILPKVAKLSVLYINVDESEEHESIIKLNNTQRKWKITDYAESYANGKNKNYKLILDFCKTHKLCHKPNGEPKLTYAYMIINGKTGQSMTASAIRSGKAVVDEAMIANADRVHSEIIEFTKAISKIGIDVSTAEKQRAIMSAYTSNGWKHSISEWCGALMKMGRKEKNELKQMPNITVKNWNTIMSKVHTFIIDSHFSEGK